MKKTLIASFVMIPSFASAQYASEGGNYNYIIAGLLILIFLFFVLRGLNCWYWKINEGINNQKEIIRLLKKIAKEEDQIAETSNKKNRLNM